MFLGSFIGCSIRFGCALIIDILRLEQIVGVQTEIGVFVTDVGVFVFVSIRSIFDHAVAKCVKMCCCAPDGGFVSHPLT